MQEEDKTAVSKFTGEQKTLPVKILLHWAKLAHFWGIAQGAMPPVLIFFSWQYDPDHIPTFQIRVFELKISL